MREAKEIPISDGLSNAGTLEDQLSETALINASRPGAARSKRPADAFGLIDIREPAGTRRRDLRALSAIALGLVLGALIVWAFGEGRKERSITLALNQPIETLLILSTGAGENVISLDRLTHEKLGIETVILKPILRQEEIRASGTALPGYPPTGSKIQGVIIPVSSVIPWSGKEWVYLQKRVGRFGQLYFVRREVPTEVPAAEGWFATEGVSPGDLIVISGARQLLSEELRLQNPEGRRVKRQ